MRHLWRTRSLSRQFFGPSCRRRRRGGSASVDSPCSGRENSLLCSDLFVGVDFNFSQYIQDNIEEAVSGVKGENSVKIFGRDLPELERLSKTLKSEIATVPGVTNPGAFNLLGQPNLVIRIDRAKAARYGFSVA